MLLASLAFAGSAGFGLAADSVAGTVGGGAAAFTGGAAGGVDTLAGGIGFVGATGDLGLGSAPPSAVTSPFPALYGAFERV